MKLMTTTALAALAAAAVANLVWVPERRALEDTAAPTGGATRLPARPRGDAAPAPPASTPAAAARHAADCTVVTRYLPQEDGTLVEAISCEPAVPAARHPYASYSDDALETLAYGDAGAAEVLGMRLIGRDEEAALSLILRSSALAGGATEPILAYANAYPRPVAVNGRPVRKTVHVRFVLSAVTELLGGDAPELPYWEQQIRRASSEPEREIALLRERARRIVAEMRRVELEVTGGTSFGGQSDA